jgi:uncharacterized protein (TIGR00297 family)
VTVLFVLVGAIVFLVIISLLLQKWWSEAGALPRKVLHIGAIFICACAVYLVEVLQALWLATLAALIPIALAVWLGAFRDPSSGRRSWGMLYFAMVYAVLLWFFGEDEPALVFYPMAILALADGMATVVGERLGKLRFRWGGDERSLMGSVVFFVMTLAMLLLGHFVNGQLPLWSTFDVTFLVFVALFVTVVEAISESGRDNIWIPLAVAYWLLIARNVDIDAFGVSVTTFMLILFAFFAYRKRWLNAGGAASAALLGAVLVLAPAPALLWVAAVFFLLGTGFSHLPFARKPVQKDRKPKARKEADGRSKSQVFSNGGFPVLSLMLYFCTGMEGFIFGYFAGFAAALSDTASSELGVRLSSRSYALIGFKPLMKGVSGGISLPGTLFGMCFAALIPGVAYVTGLMDAEPALLVGFIAFAANLVDSMLGQFLQAKTLYDNGAWVDAVGIAENNNFRGLRWMNNDLVNALSTALATTAAVWVFWG